MLINSTRFFRQKSSFSFAGDPHSFSSVDLVPAMRGGTREYKNWAGLRREFYRE